MDIFFRSNSWPRGIGRTSKISATAKTAVHKVLKFLLVEKVFLQARIYHLAYAPACKNRVIFYVFFSARTSQCFFIFLRARPTLFLLVLQIKTWQRSYSSWSEEPGSVFILLAGKNLAAFLFFLQLRTWQCSFYSCR